MHSKPQKYASAIHLLSCHKNCSQDGPRQINSAGKIYGNIFDILNFNYLLFQSYFPKTTFLFTARTLKLTL